MFSLLLVFFGDLIEYSVFYRHYQMEQTQEKTEVVVHYICALCEPPQNSKGLLVQNPTQEQVEALKDRIKERFELDDRTVQKYHEFLQSEDPKRIRYSIDSIYSAYLLLTCILI